MSMMETIGIIRLDGLVEIQRMYHHTDRSGNIYLPQVSYMRSIVDDQDMYLLPTMIGEKTGKLIFEQIEIDQIEEIKE
jgi:hypothetical protein